MKTRNQIMAMAIVAIITLAFATCTDDPEPTHTHEWEWVVTTAATTEADGVETQQCKTCGGINDTRPIAKLITPCDCATPSKHGTTAHLGIGEQCTCPATVKPCGCTEQTATIEGTTIIIRKEAGVTVSQMNTAVALVQKAYDDGLTVGQKSNLKNIVTEIHIVQGTALTRQGGIVKVGIADELEDVGYYFEDVAGGIE